MITPEKAQQNYEAAVSALQECALTPGMSSAERRTLRDAIRDLTDRYLGQLELEIQALTTQYQSFIASITAVVETLKGGATPVKLMNRLTRLVNTGAAWAAAPNCAPIAGVSSRRAWIMVTRVRSSRLSSRPARKSSSPTNTATACNPTGRSPNRWA